MKIDPPRETLYRPLMEWIISHLPPRGQVLVGVNGPQGIGKSTCCAFVAEELSRKGIPSVSLSIDDFYLTYKEQNKLAEAHPDNPYLRQRGYPGTHDIELGEKLLRTLKSGGFGKLRLPSYNKGAYQGRGDRRPEKDGPVVQEPLRVLLLEGWMLGFQPIPEERVQDPHLLSVNKMLASYSRWMRYVDLFVQLSPQTLEDILDWRVESERNRRQQGEGAMSDEQARRYIELFMPAYEAYLPTLELISLPKIKFTIGKDRHPVKTSQ